MKIGDVIKIISMEDEPRYAGRAGEIKRIDNDGQIHGTWGGCAIIPEIDKFEIVSRICPICRKSYSGYPAISRKDNQTEICPDCSQEEAILDFIKYRENKK